MASIRSALRCVPRRSLLSSPNTESRIVALARRTYAAQHVQPALIRRAPTEAEDDPNQNGNYPDPSTFYPLPLKRQLRDPYGKYFDQQERRNFGEIPHEDNDILGRFALEEYTHFTPQWGAVLIGCFGVAFGALCYVVYLTYPDMPAVPKTYPNGLEVEYGGPGSMRARKEGDE